MSVDADEFRRTRAGLGPVPGPAPEPCGWSPERTATGPVQPRPEGADRWDHAPSPNPYPSAMPDPMQPGQVLDHHARALRGIERVAFDQALLVEGGERSRRAELRTAILRRKALAEELGTGVVELTPAELAFLEDDGPEEALA